MLKVRHISFHNHPVLGSLDLDFSLPSGEIADSVILAGENGTGKSAVMEALFGLFSTPVNPLGFEADVDIAFNGKERKLRFYWREAPNGAMTYVDDDMGFDEFFLSSVFRDRYPFHALYSDVDISFQAKPIRTVTSLELDARKESRRSTSDLPTQINQLIIDIQAQDDADFVDAVRRVDDFSTPISSIVVPQRIPRFTRAFSRVFDTLSYSRVINSEGHKEILFTKNGVEIPIQALSSGEKQIVYRGAFLLQDVNALSGALVLIDEPEISLHPRWQEKILDYYKAIFTDDCGVQTSQIICATHSPFIIHNENRCNDKVIVLKRSEEGDVEVENNPSYYKCDTLEAIKDAFELDWLSSENMTVYVEGMTDERYFKKAIEAFHLNVSFSIKWIGGYGENGSPINTGETALRSGSKFLQVNPTHRKAAFLFDCDVKSCNEGIVGSVLNAQMPVYESSKGIKRGIENALLLDGLDIAEFYSEKKYLNDYGGEVTTSELEKMRLCDMICSLEDNQVKITLLHLKEMVERLELFFKTGDYQTNEEFELVNEETLHG